MTTKDSIKCKFLPTTEGLHAYDVPRDTKCDFFRRTVPNNVTACGNTKCHVGHTDQDAIESDSDNEDGGFENGLPRLLRGDEVNSDSDSDSEDDDEEINHIERSRRRFRDEDDAGVSSSSDNVESNTGEINEENAQSNEDAGVTSVDRGEGEAIQMVEGSRK